MRLAGKTVIITGAGRGVGRACATLFAAEGADLVLVDAGQDIDAVPYPLASPEQLNYTARLCTGLDATAEIILGDIRDAGTSAEAVACAGERFGRLDVVVNNAGIAGPSGSPVHDVKVDDWQVMLDVNLTGPFQMMKAAIPLMLRRRSGSIVNVSSTAGLVGYRHFAGYVAAKHGLVGLTKAAALDYAPMGIRVNALCPGSVRDDPSMDGRMLSEIARSLEIPAREYEQAFRQQQPGNALVEPHAVAAAALWLASDESAGVTGTTVTVDGGYVAR